MRPFDSGRLRAAFAQGKQSAMMVALCGLLGCAAAPTSVRGFAAPPDAVRAAVRRSLTGFGDVRQEGDRFMTGWASATPSGDEQGPILGHEYRYRACHEVMVTESKVSVTSRAERRAPGGPRSIRWERVDPAPFSRAVLDRVEKDLEGSK